MLWCLETVWVVLLSDHITPSPHPTPELSQLFSLLYLVFDSLDERVKGNNDSNTVQQYCNIFMILHDIFEVIPLAHFAPSAFVFLFF